MLDIIEGLIAILIVIIILSIEGKRKKWWLLSVGALLF